MTLIKSLLLGSAAGIVAVSAAQAADLPTRKGPVAAEYVRICSITVAGAPVVGFVLPGSDTCFKISGYVTGQVEGGNVSTSYLENFVNGPSTVAVSTKAIAPGLRNGNALTPSGHGVDQTNAGVALPANFTRFGGFVGADRPYLAHGVYAGTQSIIGNTPFNSNSFGFTTRFNLAFDAVSNTAYGPLVSHAELQFNHGEGFDNTGRGGSDGGLNRAYVTWAGLTAGKIDSFFSFTGGGLGWANFFSADRKGFDQPDVLAYTASFGGGFSATLSAESPANIEDQGDDASSIANQSQAAGVANPFLGSANRGGIRFPDIVGALDVKQAWGAAHVAGVAHDVRAESLLADGTTLDKWGYAIDAGVSFNIPNLAGSQIGLTGSWSKNAIVASGLVDGMWGEEGQVNGNGTALALADAFANGDGTWSTPTAWSVTGWANFVINPQVTIGFEGSYGEVQWSGKSDFGINLYDGKSFLVGGVAHYDPVKNLDFEFELLYQATQNDRPLGYIGGALAPAGTTTSWHGNSDGFAARFEVTRSF